MAFHKVVASGKSQDAIADHEGARHLTIGYERAGFEVGIELKLKEFEIVRRWTEAGPLGFPMLESSIARQNRKGRVEVRDATLTFGKEVGWLFAPPGTGRYIAGYHGLKPAPLKLTVPNGSVEIEAMGTGTILWDNGQVTIDAIDLQGEPIIKGDQ